MVRHNRWMMLDDIKNNKEIYQLHVLNDLNSSLSPSHFHNDLKKVEFVPTYERDGKNTKSNYRPIMILTYKNT